jgi:Cu/Zn superoxide dismutase
MCKLARRELFKPNAVEGGDITILTIPLFDYNLLLNTNSQSSSHLSLHLHFHLQRQQRYTKKLGTTVSFWKANNHIGMPEHQHCPPAKRRGYRNPKYHEEQQEDVA